MTQPMHITKLKSEFEKRAARNRNYSLRAYARDLGMSPAALSGLLNLKKGLSEATAQDIAERLGFSKAETQAFLVSVASQHSRSPKKRKTAQEQLKKNLQRQTRQQKIESENFAQIQNWYSLSLLELMELDSCTHKIEWFTEKLQLSSIVIKNALRRLIHVGLVEFKDGKYQPLTEESTTSEDLPSDDIKNFHAEMLKKSEVALYTNPVTEREFINMTLAFPSAEIKEAQEMIRDFQAEFAERFYHQSKKKKNSVYQLSMQFFRIDQKEK